MRILIILGLSMAMLYACSNGEKKGPVSGYSYKIYKDAGNKKPEIGFFVRFQMEILDDSSKVLQTYDDDEDNMPSLQIVGRDNEARKSNPILDILSELSWGDEVGIFVPRDSIPNMPPGFEYIKRLEYRIKVREVMSEDSYNLMLADQRQGQMMDMEAAQARLPEVEAFAKNSLQEYKAGKWKFETSPMGVKYIIHESGSGPVPKLGENVSVGYYGMLVSNGFLFDNSFSKGIPYTFPVGRETVIAGWDEIMGILPKGTKASIIVPGVMGYGAQGYPPDIPPDAELYFYIEPN